MNRMHATGYKATLLLFVILPACASAQDGNETATDSTELTTAASAGASSPLQTAQRTPGNTLHAWLPGFQQTATAPRLANATTPAQDAANFDLIIDPAGHGDAQSAAVVDSMHAINPTLRYLTYWNGCCDMGKDTTNYPESSYAHTAGGARIQGAGGALEMNRRDAMWRGTRVSLCAHSVAALHEDGCFFDSSSYRWFVSGSGAPIDPATGATWTQANYDQQGQQIFANVRAGLPSGKLLALNGLGAGSGYFAQGGSALLPAVDLAMAETWITDPGTATATYDTEAKWLSDIKQAADVSGRGKGFIPTVKNWSSNGTTAQRDQLLRFSMASFLLGANPATSYFDYQPEQSRYGASQFYAVYNRTKIGAPTTTFTKLASGAYSRTYQKGRVLVNAGTSSVTVALGGTFTDLDGTSVNTLTLPAHTGQVLTAQ